MPAAANLVLERGNSTCPKCKKVFTDDEQAVGCDGKCQKWFHKECSGITQGEFNILKSRNCSLMWFCLSCNPKMMSKDNSEIYDEMKGEIKAVNGKFDKLSEMLLEKIDSLVAWQQSVQKSVEQNKVEEPVAKQTDVNMPLPGQKASYSGSVKNTTSVLKQTPKNHIEGTFHIDKEQPIQTAERDKSDIPGNKKKIVPMRGQGGTQKGKLRAGAKKIWVYIGRLNKDTVNEDILSYLSDNGISEDITCEELVSKGPNKAFKIGALFDFKDKIYDADFWPDGVIYRPFRF